METPVKYMFLLAFLLSMTIAGLNGVVGTGYYYGPCGKHDIEKEAEKLEPCTYAAQHWRAPVSERCCTVMEKKVKNPACLCAVLFSQTAYNAGVRPEIAVSIPKRCNIADRPVGYKCGGTSSLLSIKSMFQWSLIQYSDEAIVYFLQPSLCFNSQDSPLHDISRMRMQDSL
ncbi:hypothetical protein V6N13_038432 [Hibiscus sabdariffa]|uniref:Bifunctional inhibitor/plant lipid transfer protein/seed storage helical domain-containing protein n=1 Tax=Hibiscus sabdariffa TaxID=183260 RepID=A0ABR2S1Y5_9ROSI